MVASGGMGAIAVVGRLLLGMHGTGRGDRILVRGLRHRLRPGFPTLNCQLTRGFDGRLVRGDPAAEIVEHREARTLLDSGEDDLKLSAVQCFLLQEFRGQHVEHVAVLGQDRPRLVVRGLDQLADLVIDVAGDFVAVISLGTHSAAQERIAVLGAVAHRTQFGTHAVLGDHRARNLGRLLNIGDRTGGRLPEHQLLGGPATHGEHESGDHFRPGHQALVILGYRHRVPTGAAAGQDRNFINRLDIGHRPRSQGVAALVVGGDLLLRLADDPTLATRAADDPVDGLFQRGPGDDGPVLAGRK